MKVAAAILVPLLIIAGGVVGLYEAGYLGRLLPGHARVTARKHASSAARLRPPIAIARPSASPPALPHVNTAQLNQPPTPRPPKSAAVSDPAEVEQKLSKLAAIYEAMPAEDAAKVLPALPDPLLVQILKRMDERIAARTLASLDRKRAVRLTLALAR